MRSSRTTSDRGRSATDGRSDGTSKPGCGALPTTAKRLAEVRARQLEDDVCRQAMRYCAECLPSYPSLRVGAVLLVSAERFDDPERPTPQSGQARNPDMHAAGNAGQAT